MQYQILKTNITRTIWQTVGRITKEILGVKGLKISFCQKFLWSLQKHQNSGSIFKVYSFLSFCP